MIYHLMSKQVLKKQKAKAALDKANMKVQVTQKKAREMKETMAIEKRAMEVATKKGLLARAAARAKVGKSVASANCTDCIGQLGD